jgi:hypothetical protein
MSGHHHLIAKKMDQVRADKEKRRSRQYKIRVDSSFNILHF